MDLFCPPRPQCGTATDSPAVFRGLLLRGKRESGREGGGKRKGKGGVRGGASPPPNILAQNRPYLRWGLWQSPSRQTIWCIGLLQTRSAAQVAAVFVQKITSVLRKIKLDFVRRVQFLKRAAPYEFFFWSILPALPYGSRRLCC